MLRIGFQESFRRALRKADKKDPGLAADVRAALKAVVAAEPASQAGLTAKKGALRGIFVKNLSHGRRIFFRREVAAGGEVFVAFWVGEHDYYQKLQRSGRRGGRARRQ